MNAAAFAVVCLLTFAGLVGLRWCLASRAQHGVDVFLGVAGATCLLGAVAVAMLLAAGP